MKPDPIYRNGYKDKQRMEDMHNIPCSLCYLKGWTQATRTTVHHKTGMGLGKKASDVLSLSLCDSHHQKGPDAFHHIGKAAWEKKFIDQDSLIELTNKLLTTINN